MSLVYFDYNATTPLDPEVRDSMLPFLGELYGNPSSVHQIGVRARALLDEAHDRVATVWGCKPSEVVFTSGGTEADNMAIRGAVAGYGIQHVISAHSEHHAVGHSIEELEKEGKVQAHWLNLNQQGEISLDG